MSCVATGMQNCNLSFLPNARTHTHSCYAGCLGPFTEKFSPICFGFVRTFLVALRATVVDHLIFTTNTTISNREFESQTESLATVPRFSVA